MAYDFDAQFSGGSTALSGYTPNTGSAFSGISGTLTVNGSGRLVAGSTAYADCRVTALADATFYLKVKNAASLLTEFAIHSVGAGFSGAYVTFNYKSGTGGISFAKNDVDQVTKTTGFTATTDIVALIVVNVNPSVSTRYRAWIDGNVDPDNPDLDWTDNSPIASTRSAIYHDAAGGEWDYISAEPGAFPPAETIPSLASPVQVRSRRLRGSPFRTLTLRGNGAPSVADPLYIGAAGAAVVDKGTTAPTSRYLGPRTLF